MPYLLGLFHWGACMVNKFGTITLRKSCQIGWIEYRPVSLTCLCCKILEHIILSYMPKSLATNDIINSKQHGFRKGLSCETQLVEAINDWAYNINRQHQTDVIFLDFSKSFDKVSQRKLLHKLEYFGITGQTHIWLQAFLTGRSQSIFVNGATSPLASVLSGVPHGSVLGPVLYINDISDGVLSSIRLFADDCVLYRQVQTREDYTMLQQDLLTLSQLAKLWDMSFNVKKCAHMCIPLKRKPTINDYNMDGQQVPKETTYKYLGVTVPNYLSWNTHAQKIQAMQGCPDSWSYTSSSRKMPSKSERTCIHAAC